MLVDDEDDKRGRGKTDLNMPYVLVGDDAFALKTYMMKPYPQRNLSVEKRVYNYRHSRARRISENLFGIVANRWRVFRGVLNLAPEKAMSITICALVLHNFLRKTKSRHVYSPPGLADSTDENGKIINGEWRDENSPAAFQSLEQFCGNNPSRSAKLVRDTFKDHFMNEGGFNSQGAEKIKKLTSVPLVSHKQGRSSYKSIIFSISSSFQQYFFNFFSSDMLLWSFSRENGHVHMNMCKIESKTFEKRSGT